MQVYLMRHGEAANTRVSDPQRPLTKQGQVEASLMAKWLSNMKINIDHVLVSPYLRAQQTASHMLEPLDDNVSLDTVDFITPSGIAAEVHHYIDGLCANTNIEHLMIISHMPLMSYLVAELTYDHQAPIFQTAAIAQIDYNLSDMKGQLLRLIAPIDLC